MSCNAQSRFDFQHVLGPTCSQQEVYEHTVRPWGHMLAIKTDEGLHILATFWPVLLTRERWGPQVLPMVEDVLRGQNAAVIAYGQTGSGTRRLSRPIMT